MIKSWVLSQVFEHFSELVDWMNFIWHPKGTLQIGRLKSSKNSWYYVDITMAPIDSCFIIFCSPGTPTHSLLWSNNSQLSKQNVQYYKTISLWAQLCIPSRLRLKVLRWPVNDSPIGLSCYSEVFTTQKY